MLRSDGVDGSDTLVLLGDELTPDTKGEELEKDEDEDGDDEFCDFGDPPLDEIRSDSPKGDARPQLTLRIEEGVSTATDKAGLRDESEELGTAAEAECGLVGNECDSNKHSLFSVVMLLSLQLNLLTLLSHCDWVPPCTVVNIFPSAPSKTSILYLPLGKAQSKADSR